MNAELYYATGEEVHAGDRIQHKGSFGRVVFVSDGANEEFEPGYGDYTGLERGVMICDDDGETISIGEPDYNLVFLNRE